MVTNVWWEAQNTGWTEGMSWFDSAGGVKFSTYEEAAAFNKGRMRRLSDPEIKWRIVRVTSTREVFQWRD